MKMLLKILLYLGVVVAVSLIPAGLTMLLWNWLAPMFWAGAPVLTLWATWGVLLLLGFIAGALGLTNKK